MGRIALEVACVLVVCGLLGLYGLLFMRDQVVEAVPSSIEAYSALRIPVEAAKDKIVFRNVVYDFALKNNRRVFTVEGELANPTPDKPLPVTDIELRIFDQNEMMLVTTRNPPPKRFLQPGETSQFVITLENPPERAYDYSVSLRESR